jgi:DNA mismatch repair protein MutL
LPDDLANQIAAGEVVERPASVVKELCENALDAGATRLTIEIEGGGVNLCRVTDDGVGMTEADLKLSVLRHATSKIETVDDLCRIGSFGFRGEALPSIASVSRIRIESRAKGTDAGVALVAEGGGAAMMEPCGAPAGTSVEVRELFYNVPARRKFLRALATESAHVTEVVQAVALGAPGVTVMLTRDGRKVREHLRASSRADRVRDVLQGEELVSCTGVRGPLTLEAHLSKPERARVGATSLWIFVNGRPVKDRALARAVSHAYGSVLEPGRYPVGVVYLDLAAELVDVNVHPQKSEVRFADGRAVSDAVYRIVESGLGAAFTGAATRTQTTGSRGPSPWSASWGRRHADEVPSEPIWDGSGVSPLAQSTPIPYPTHGGAAQLLSAEDASSLPAVAEFVAQVRGMFLLCETTDALVIVDQHAAAERVTFDRLKRSFSERRIAMQALLVPELVRARASEVALVEEAQEAIAALGLDLRSAGNDAIAVHAVPQILVRANPADLARSLVGELSRSATRDFSGAIDLVLATMACHGSIRAGDRVSPEEARELLAALSRVEFGGHCPHGRPIVMRLPFRELEHRVGRR